MSGEGGGRTLGEEWQEVGAAEAGDVVGGALQDRKQVCSGWLKKLSPLTVRPLTRHGWVRRSCAGPANPLR